MPGIASFLAAALLAASPVQHAQAQLQGPVAVGEADRSSNWAGYALSAGDGASEAASFTDVTGTWTEPAVSCHPGSAAASGFWVGLGGFSDTSQSVEQIGTSANCLYSGRPLHYAWYELFPAPAVRLNLTIRPGDRILGAVASTGDEIVLELKNVSRNVQVTKTIAVESPDLTSAEWIAEAPSMCDAVTCATFPLARFGRVAFGRAAATSGGHMGTITDPAWQATPIVLVPASVDPQLLIPRNDSGASPSQVTGDGRAFTVTWGVTAEP